jgi:hypothetical protein
MLTAVPLPNRPLTILWQSTVVDIEPGSRYAYKNDAAAINTTLAVVNDTGQPLQFPLILATTDPEERLLGTFSMLRSDLGHSTRFTLRRCRSKRSPVRESERLAKLPEFSSRGVG